MRDALGVVKMSPETQVLLGVIITAGGLLVAFAGLFLTVRRLRHGRREAVTIASKRTTPAPLWVQAELTLPWNEVNHYWVEVTRGPVVPNIDTNQISDPAGRTSFRVPDGPTTGSIPAHC